MSRYYYSTQPFIAWIINQFFFYGRHFVYMAPFYPYRLGNPKSSNPYLIYSDLYLPWKDKDVYDKTIAQYRMNLRKGINNSCPDSELKTDLLNLCDKISIDFFCPIVYRIDVNRISNRIESAGSGLTGSDEYLVRDLQIFEFSILFDDEIENNLNLKTLYDLKDNPDCDLFEVLNLLKVHFANVV